MPLSRYWKWVMDFMQSLFQTLTTSSPPSQPVELCNDILFEIFLRLPPKVLPCLSILNKQSNEMIKSPLFQTTYWAQKLRLPRLYAMVYYERKLTNRIGFALINKEHDHRLDKNEFLKYTQIPHIHCHSSCNTRLLQWTESMLKYYEMGPNGIRTPKANGPSPLTPHRCDRPAPRPVILHSA